MIFTGTYGDKMHIVPYQKMSETPAPPKKRCLVPRTSLPISRRGAWARPRLLYLDYGTRSREFAILGNLAMKAGKGNKVIWMGRT